MGSRIYLPSSGAPTQDASTTPPYGVWDNTASMTRIQASPHRKLNTAMTTLTLLTGNTTNQSYARVQYVTPPMKGSSYLLTGDRVMLQMSLQETSALNEMYLAFALSFWDVSLATDWDIFAVDKSTTGKTEFAVALTNKSGPYSSGSSFAGAGWSITMPFAMAAGDYLYWEIGVWQNAANEGDTASFRVGDAGDPELPFREEISVADICPYLEFSRHLEFDTDPAPVLRPVYYSFPY